MCYIYSSSEREAAAATLIFLNNLFTLGLVVFMAGNGRRMCKTSVPRTAEGLPQCRLNAKSSYDEVSYRLQLMYRTPFGGQNVGILMRLTSSAPNTYRFS